MNGHLTQRGKRGVWYLTFDIGEPGRKREQQRVRLGQGPRSHAVSEARKILCEVDEGRWVKVDRSLTVKKFVAQWLDARKGTIAHKTWSGYEMRTRLHIVPIIGDIPVGKLQSRHVSSIYDAMRKKGLSGTTQLDTHRILHNALEYARDEKVLTENVTERIKAPTATPKEHTTINPERVWKILDVVKGAKFEMLILVCALTGLRRGELLALKWPWIDLDGTGLFDPLGPALKVVEALEHTRGHGVRFKEPKSRKSRRVIPLAPECVELLRRHKDEQDDRKAEAGEAYTDLGLVFPNPDGTPWKPDSLSVQFRRLAKLAGCEGFRLHDLRHAAGTLLVAEGASIRDVSSLLGHSSPAFTLSTYTHAVDETARAAMSNLARVLLRRTKGARYQTVTKSLSDPVSA